MNPELLATARVTDIPCKLCGAGVGEVCHYPDGRRSTRTHKIRIKRYHEHLKGLRNGLGKIDQTR